MCVILSDQAGPFGWERVHYYSTDLCSLLSMSEGVAVGGVGVECWLRPGDMNSGPGHRLVILLVQRAAARHTHTQLTVGRLQVVHTPTSTSSLSLSLSLTSNTHTHTHTLSLSLSLTHTHTHQTHILSLSLTHTHTHNTHTLSLTHTHHTHTEKIVYICILIFPG